MEVVINDCYGGFGVSAKAILDLYLKKSPIVYTHAYDTQRSGFTDKEELAPGFYSVFGDRLIDMNNKVSIYLQGERTDPDLIDVVRRLGKDANGFCASLKIIEIPDDVQWDIQEYDGVEWIAEKHRTWS